MPPFGYKHTTAARAKMKRGPDQVPRKRRPTEDPLRRFAAFVKKTDGCWLWLGHVDDWGYGRFKVGQNSVKAHRWTWEQEYGPIPDGILVCHSCDNPPCVRAENLFLGTHADNAHDRDYKGRDWQSRTEQCPQGHPYDEENTYIIPSSGGRSCRECKWGSNGRYHDRNRDTILARQKRRYDRLVGA